jgi:LPXTG-motif cell wall-anchored protein
MAQLSDLTPVIGFAAANYQGEMVALLTRNGVIVPTETLTTKMLVELIVNALAESPSFGRDFTAWAESKASLFNSFTDPTLSADGQGGINWGKAWDNLLKGGQVVGSYVQGKQQKAAADSLAAAEQAKLEAERIAAEREDKSFASKLALSQAGTTKVVIFGLVGLAAIGGAIWYFTRKK